MNDKNKSICIDRENGMSVVDIADKYGVSRARVYQILSKVSIAGERKETELWKRLEQAANRLGGYGEPQISRAYNIVMRARKTIPNTWPVRSIPFGEIPRDEWREIRNCGQKTLKLLYAAFPE